MTTDKVKESATVTTVTSKSGERDNSVRTSAIEHRPLNCPACQQSRAPAKGPAPGRSATGAPQLPRPPFHSTGIDCFWSLIWERLAGGTRSAGVFYVNVSPLTPSTVASTTLWTPSQNKWTKGDTVGLWHQFKWGKYGDLNNLLRLWRHNWNHIGRLLYTILLKFNPPSTPTLLIWLFIDYVSLGW